MLEDTIAYLSPTTGWYRYIDSNLKAVGWFLVRFQHDNILISSL